MSTRLSRALVIKHAVHAWHTRHLHCDTTS